MGIRVEKGSFMWKYYVNGIEKYHFNLLDMIHEKVNIKDLDGNVVYDFDIKSGETSYEYHILKKLYEMHHIDISEFTEKRDPKITFGIIYTSDIGNNQLYVKHEDSLECLITRSRKVMHPLQSCVMDEKDTMCFYHNYQAVSKVITLIMDAFDDGFPENTGKCTLPLSEWLSIIDLYQTGMLKVEDVDEWLIVFQKISGTSVHSIEEAPLYM